MVIILDMKRFLFVALCYQSAKLNRLVVSKTYHGRVLTKEFVKRLQLQLLVCSHRKWDETTMCYFCLVNVRHFSYVDQHQPVL